MLKGVLMELRIAGAGFPHSLIQKTSYNTFFYVCCHTWPYACTLILSNLQSGIRFFNIKLICSSTSHYVDSVFELTPLHSLNLYRIISLHSEHLSLWFVHAMCFAHVQRSGSTHGETHHSPALHTFPILMGPGLLQLQHRLGAS